MILSTSPDHAPPALAADWQHIAPAGAGFTPELAELHDDAMQRGQLPNIHAVVVACHGKLVLERYYEGPDQRWGWRLGTVEFGPEVKHDLRSISKSIVGLLYGIALAQERVPSLDQPIIDQFPAYRDLAADPSRRRMTIAHAFSMTLGTEWDESLPYSDPRNSEIAMERAADRYRFVLDRPMVADPGTRWVYNGGATAVLAHLIAVGTGTPLLDFARRQLFEPLGIADVEWIAGSNGEPAAASGLPMRPRDLARIGQLVLDRGRRGDWQVVPAEWLDASFGTRVSAEDGLEYGYHWWLGGTGAGGRRWIAGFGNGGQRLVVVPDLDLVVVVTAGNYNAPDAWKVPVAVMLEVVLPALRSR